MLALCSCADNTETGPRTPRLRINDRLVLPQALHPCSVWRGEGGSVRLLPAGPRLRTVRLNQSYLNQNGVKHVQVSGADAELEEGKKKPKGEKKQTHKTYFSLQSKIL